MNIVIIQPSVGAVSETFIAAHAEHLREVTGVVHFLNGRPALDGKVALSQRLVPRGWRKIKRVVQRAPWTKEIEDGVVRGIQNGRADVVLAEYGSVAAKVTSACHRLSVPLVTHFHGYDASSTEFDANFYKGVFSESAVVIAVSWAMHERLLELGCPQEKLIYSPYGVDPTKFSRAAPGDAPPHLLAVGRFVEKKAPYLTLLAFSRAKQQVADAQLTFIGDGPLLPVCQRLVQAMGLQSSVRFLGAQSHNVVQREMHSVRAFVQHSVVASNGDSEGTPVAVLEAGMSGLPVVATRHAGIPDVVVDNETGLLCDEGDVDQMAESMERVLSDPELAGRLGRQARVRVAGRFTMHQSIARLQRVLEAAANGEDLVEVQDEIAGTFLSDASV
ncbi:GDP-mannose-dependent alpha-(1-6)-phosphatidylinositol monomannoside mannosyltransferase [Roseimaritima multifibrata]|uniref:GDP-mannose-dependent alpha-(1-6)-phosphatidylinositol monomannoside mannosyltransferase n=1 Tax=Roseimaritima multifibrata TaxID=1930274 RepID=A0A517MN92_9BACT|nr:glycosyltransferase [Roseimaritima multifibrata]QDS96349.1 GDP-mannose-dependent alpha-(1-6)-phosphatidylinositol monomannoside mannosyltransferase [Roseimaritima multifibrata]